MRDNELLVVSFLGAAVLVAGVSELLGVADAIGAFMAGLIFAGTPAAPRVRKLVHPLRDAFGAIFFFVFGLAIDPGDVLPVAGPVAAAVALTVVMNVAAGLFVARVHRYGPRPASDIATTLVARGEFALILAAMAAGAGLDRRLTPFVAGYVLVLAVLGPTLAGRSHRLAGAPRRGDRDGDDDRDEGSGDGDPPRPEGRDGDREPDRTAARTRRPPVSAPRGRVCAGRRRIGTGPRPSEPPRREDVIACAPHSSWPPKASNRSS